MQNPMKPQRLKAPHRHDIYNTNLPPAGLSPEERLGHISVYPCHGFLVGFGWLGIFISEGKAKRKAHLLSEQILGGGPFEEEQGLWRSRKHAAVCHQVTHRA